MGKFDESDNYPQLMANRAAFDIVSVETALLTLLAEHGELEIGLELFHGDVPLNIGGGIGITAENDDPGTDLRQRNYEFACEGYDVDYERLTRRFSRLAGMLPLRGVTAGGVYFISIHCGSAVRYSKSHEYGRIIHRGRLGIEAKVEVNQLEELNA